MYQADQLQSGNQAGSVASHLPMYNHTIWDELPSYNSNSPTFPKAADIIAEMNSNYYGMMSWFAHGGTGGQNSGAACLTTGVAGFPMWKLDAEDAYEYHNVEPEDNDGLDNLTNYNNPFVIYSISCDITPFDITKTMNNEGARNCGESFTVNNLGGGIAFLGNTRYGWIGTSYLLFNKFADLLTQSTDNPFYSHIGVAELISKQNFSSHYLHYSHNLIGGPETQMWTTTPQLLTVDVNPNTAISNINNYFEVTVYNLGENKQATVCLYKENEIFATQIIEGNANNQAIAIFNNILPISTGEISVTVVSHNYIPFETVIPVEEECTITIDSDELWDTDKLISCDVVVEPDIILTIKSNISIFPEAKIIIKPQAQLIIDGGILTNACNEPWQGIEIWGNSNAHQYVDANGNYQQGYVELKNNAVIKNAYNAVTLWKPDDWQSMGGILIASDATFRNNRRAVEFMSYRNFDPATGDPRPNKSQFVNCVFETDENYFNTDDFHTFVSMWKVDGIKFYGCDFEDKRVAFQDPPYYQAVGIWTIDANFYVLPDCGNSNYDCWTCPDHNIDRSSFTGLNYAVYSSQERTTKTFVIDRADFVNNLRSILNVGNDYASCIRSNFEVGTKQTIGPYHMPVGILNYGSTGFTFNQNDFTSHTSLPSDIDFSTGIWNLYLGGDVNTIFNNNFIGLGYGNKASGDNHNNYDPYLGLTYKCNHNSSNLKYDFCTFGGEGIATYQGTEDEAAGNTFCHNTTPDGSDFANLASWPINYFYYEGNSDEDPINTIGVWKKVAPLNLCEDRYIINSNIRLSETEKDNYRQQYYDNKIEYDNTKALYESLKDGGSTPGTKLDIETSWPDETWELRAQLLADSPHLTEEVLMAAADKTDVLPHTIMFEICMANPEEMRNEGFLEYLATKDDPMPQYMIDDLRDGADEDTYKSVLQNEMAGYAYLWGTACNNLIRDIVLDSIGNNCDSLRLWLSNKESLTGEYEIVDSYLAEDDLTNALAHLNNIPVNYDLSDKQLEEYNYFHDLKTTIINAQQQGRNIFQLDSLEILDLVYIADTSKYLAGVQAQSILNFAYGYSYFDLPDLQEPNMKSGQIQSHGFHNKVVQEGKHYISAHPNPASQWVAIDYTLPYPSEKATIIIYNAFGKIVKTIELRAVIGQSIWDTRNIPSGIYFYSLHVNGSVIDKRKLIISK